jgi:hypothetical protein
MIQWQYMLDDVVNQRLESMKSDDEPLPVEEIARRRDDAIRRALNTPPKPRKELLGKSERAQTKQNGRVRKVTRSKPKGA